MRASVSTCSTHMQHTLTTVCLSRLAGRSKQVGKRGSQGQDVKQVGTGARGGAGALTLAEVRKRRPLLTALGPPRPGTEGALAFTVGAAGLRPPLQRGILSLPATAGQRTSLGLLSSPSPGVLGAGGFKRPAALPSD